MSKTASTTLAPAQENILRRIWPAVVVGLGLGLSTAWVGFLTYGVVHLIFRIL